MRVSYSGWLFMYVLIRDHSVVCILDPPHVPAFPSELKAEQLAVYYTCLFTLEQLMRARLWSLCCCGCPYGGKGKV